MMVVVVVAGMIWGAIRGITWQVASLASLVLGYAGAMTLSGQLTPHLPGQPIVARALSMLIAYVLISAAIFAVAWAVRATLRKLKFEAYDRHLGMVLGGLEGALVGVVLTLFALSLAPGTRGPILNSPSGRVVGGLFAAVGPVLPTEIRGELGPLWSGKGPTPTPEPAVADDWEELKRPIELTRRERPRAEAPSRTVVSRAEPPSELPPPPGDEVVGDSAGAEADSEELPTLGRVVAETIDAGLGKVGDKAGRAPDSRRRRIGRVLGDLLGEEIDRMNSRRNEPRTR